MPDRDRLPERYKILETINSGPRGSLCKALDQDLDKVVALKTLHISDRQTLDDLRVETKILHGLQHRGLPTVRHDFPTGDGTYVIVIDWVDGVDLQEKLDESGRPGLLHSSVVDWIGQVADALDYLHDQDPPIIHGDVKPSNIVLMRTNRVVLLDFGIARQWGQQGNAGTRGFMAPEVSMRQPVTAATDVYGLAATAFALLTGNSPASGRPDWVGIDKSAIAALEQVLERALATDPVYRHSSAGEFAKRLAAGSSALPSGNVTLLAVEIVDAMEFWDMDAQLMPDVLGRVVELVHIAIDEADGVVSGGEGGGERVLAGFSSASAALRAALTIRTRSDDDVWMRDQNVRLRMSLHNGEPDQRGGQYWGRSVQHVQRLRDVAEPRQILASWTTAPLLMDRLPPGTRLVEVTVPPSASSTTLAGPVFAVETGEIPPLTMEPRPTPPSSGPVVAPPASAPPPRRRRSSEAMAQLIRARKEVDDAVKRKLVQQDEAQRAGQPGLATKFGDEAAELSKRLLEVQRQIERLEADEGGGSAG